jgi:adenine-specific DNA-methyltransferase
MPTLNFRAKSYIKNYHLTVKYHELIPDEASSLTSEVSLNDNLVIHGDNLIALKALQPNFGGRVKCIYIDPPYNTGNESWRYNDNVNSEMIRFWLKENKPVDHEDLLRHDKWLCMMMPRLYLLKELLADDGVIFVSIDDNEVHHLRMLMDEIFTELNYIGTFVWKRRASSGLAQSMISVDHEYVVAYHNGAFEQFLGVKKNPKAYTNPDNDPNGPWTLGDLTVGMTKEQRPNQFYDLVDPKTGVHYSANPKRVWAFIPESMEREITMGRIVFPEIPTGRPMYKRYFKNLKTDINPISTWIKEASEQKKINEEAVAEESISLSSGLNSEGTRLIQTIFKEEAFPYPKPLSLIKQLIGQVAKDGDIILDSFAGSGTTGQAVLELNQEDGGNRRFVLVEMEEYADHLTAERLRRVINGIPNAKHGKLPKKLKGSFSYFRLGKPLDISGILSGDSMPSYLNLARYLFYTATGEPFNSAKVQEEKHFIGESSQYIVYLLYKADIEYLKRTALTLDFAKELPETQGKTRLVFAPNKFLDNEKLEEHNIKFVQLPFEVFRYQV